MGVCGAEGAEDTSALLVDAGTDGCDTLGFGTLSLAMAVEVGRPRAQLLPHTFALPCAAGHSSLGGGCSHCPRPLAARCLTTPIDDGIGKDLGWGVDIMRHHPGFPCHPCWLRQG